MNKLFILLGVSLLLAGCLQTSPNNLSNTIIVSNYTPTPELFVGLNPPKPISVYFDNQTSPDLQPYFLQNHYFFCNNFTSINSREQADLVIVPFEECPKSEMIDNPDGSISVAFPDGCHILDSANHHSIGIKKGLDADATRTIVNHELAHFFNIPVRLVHDHFKGNPNFMRNLWDKDLLKQYADSQCFSSSG